MLCYALLFPCENYLLNILYKRYFVVILHINKTYSFSQNNNNNKLLILQRIYIKFDLRIHDKGKDFLIKGRLNFY